MLHSDKVALKELIQIIREHQHFQIYFKNAKHGWIDIMMVSDRKDDQDYLFIIQLDILHGSFLVEKVLRSYQDAKDYKPTLKTLILEKRWLKSAGANKALAILNNAFIYDVNPGALLAA